MMNFHYQKMFPLWKILKVTSLTLLFIIGQLSTIIEIHHQATVPETVFGWFFL